MSDCDAINRFGWTSLLVATTHAVLTCHQIGRRAPVHRFDYETDGFHVQRHPWRLTLGSRVDRAAGDRFELADDVFTIGLLATIGEGLRRARSRRRSALKDDYERFGEGTVTLLEEVIDHGRLDLELAAGADKELARHAAADARERAEAAEDEWIDDVQRRYRELLRQHPELPPVWPV